MEPAPSGMSEGSRGHIAPVSYDRFSLSYRETFRLSTARLSRLTTPRTFRLWLKDLNRARQELPEHLTKWERPDGHPYSVVVVARARDRIVGYAWAVGGLDPMAHIKEVAVVAEHQRRGIGPNLVKAAAEWMAELGHESIAILPITERKTWVTKLGFRKDGPIYSVRISEIQ